MNYRTPSRAPKRTGNVPYGYTPLPEGARSSFSKARPPLASTCNNNVIYIYRGKAPLNGTVRTGQRCKFRQMDRRTNMAEIIFEDGTIVQCPRSMMRQDADQSGWRGE